MNFKVVKLFDVEQWNLLLQRCSYREEDFVSSGFLRRAGLWNGKVHAKGRNPETLQAKFDGVVRETVEIADISGSRY